MSELTVANVSGVVVAPARSQRRRGGPILDTPTLLLTASIVLLGLVMVTSASISLAGRAGTPFIFLERQLSLAFAGSIAAALAFCVPTEKWQKAALPLLALATVLLLIVLIPGIGHVVNGSRRWLRVGGLSFQVSEAARVLALIYVASYAVRYEEELREHIGALLRPLGVLILMGLLLLLEPDFGAASVLFVSGFLLLFLAGARLRFLVLMLLAAGGSMALLVRISPYRWHRVLEFMNPWADPFKGGFQLTQSLIAIGRGSVLGVGLGDSVQKLFYLPEAHTDFLFAVLAEELGLAGVVLTLALFLALTWRAFVIARRAYDAGLRFASYLASGFGLWLGVQAFINVGVNMGVLPTKGLTLPFMSYGRSSLIVTLAWLGILLRVNHEAVQASRRSLRESSV
jgi:cell division protein FtsW